MTLFKRQKSRQEKRAHEEAVDSASFGSVDTKSAQDEKSDDLLDSLADMPITEHLIELRRHLIKICAAVLIVFLALVGFSRELYDFLSDPLVAQLPANSTMIATDITSNFMAPIRLTIFVAAFFAMPYILYQIWSFVAPGLYKKRKKSQYRYYYHRSCCFMPAWLLPILWYLKAYLNSLSFLRHKTYCR